MGPFPKVKRDAGRENVWEFRWLNILFVEPDVVYVLNFGWLEMSMFRAMIGALQTTCATSSAHNRQSSTNNFLAPNSTLAATSVGSYELYQAPLRFHLHHTKPN